MINIPGVGSHLETLYHTVFKLIELVVKGEISESMAKVILGALVNDYSASFLNGVLDQAAAKSPDP